MKTFGWEGTIQMNGQGGQCVPVRKNKMVQSTGWDTAWCCDIMNMFINTLIFLLLPATLLYHTSVSCSKSKHGHTIYFGHEMWDEMTWLPCSGRRQSQCSILYIHIPYCREHRSSCWGRTSIFPWFLRTYHDKFQLPQPTPLKTCTGNLVWDSDKP